MNITEYVFILSFTIPFLILTEVQLSCFDTMGSANGLKKEL